MNTWIICFWIAWYLIFSDSTHCLLGRVIFRNSLLSMLYQRSFEWIWIGSRADALKYLSNKKSLYDERSKTKTKP